MGHVRQKWWGQLFFIVMFSCVCISCGGDSGSNPVDDNDENNNDNLDIVNGNNSEITSDVFSSDDLNTLDAAEARFETLISSSTPDQARQTLVAELASQSDITDTKLFEDGYTIMVKFENGTYGAVNTLDYNALNETAAGYEGPPAGKRNTSATGKVSKAAGVHGDVVFDNIPSTKKILILNISQPDLPGNSTAVSWIRWLFLEAGWDTNDITVKTRSTRNATNIMPEDFFELEDYGIVFIFAHGIYGSFDDDDQTSYYLQLGSANTVGSSAYTSELKQAVRDGQIVICDGDYYMRMDLLTQVLATPDRGMVFLIGSRGYNASGTFQKDMYGRFFGWDDVPMPMDSYQTLRQFIEQMTTAKPAISDAESYFDDTLDITSVNPDGRTATFHMVPEAGDMYLPAWAELIISNISAPSNAVRFDVGVQIDNRTVISEDFAVISGTVDIIPPGVSNCFARAYDVNDEYIIAATQPDTIVVGQNVIELDFKKQVVYGIWNREDYSNDNKFFPMSAGGYTAFIWKKVGTERSYVIYTNDGYRIEYVEPVDVTNLSIGLGGYCFNQEQIITMNGSALFPMEDDELAVIEFIEYKYNPSRDEDVEEVNGYWESIKNYCENKPWEVFPY